MSYFKVIVPQSGVNLIKDPIFGAADPDTSYDIAGDGSGSPDVTRSTADALFGDGCGLFALSTSAYVRLYQPTVVTATSYTLSAYVKRSGGGAVTSTQAVLYFDSGDVTPSYTLIRDGCYYLEYTATATNGTRNFGVKALENGLKVFAIQLENTAYATTLIHGDIEGFRDDGYRWTGTAHASTSTRHTQERSGGRVRDMWTDLLANIRSFVGGGAVEDNIITTSIAAGPGAVYQNNIIQPRSIDLGISFNSSTIGNLHTRRNTFYEAIKARLVTPIQPFVFRYTGNAEPLEINARYAGGLELTRLGNGKTIEQTGIRMLCENPFWRSIGNDASQLDVQDTLTTNYIAQRSALGEWSNLATTLNAVTRALAKTTDGNLYIGGDSTAPGSYVQLWNGSSLAAVGSGSGGVTHSLVPSGTNIYAGTATEVRYWNGSTWAAVGDLNLDANGTINAMAIIGSTLFIGGAFTQIANKIDIDYLAAFNLSTGAWSSVDSGVSSEVKALAVNGTNLYIATGTNVKLWNGSSLSTLGNLGENALALAYYVEPIGFTGAIYAGFASGPGDGIRYWNGSTWETLLGGLQHSGNAPICNTLLVLGANMYIGGRFDTADSTANTQNICYVESSFLDQTYPLHSGISTGQVYALATDGTDVYVGGSYTGASGVSNTARIARYDVGDNLFNALSTGIGSGQVSSLVWDGSATLFLGGTFANEGDANGDKVLKYTSGTFSSLSTGVGDEVKAMAYSSANLYLGGAFTTPYTRLAKWNLTAFSDIQSSTKATFGSIVHTLCIDVTNTILYIGGAFATINTSSSYTYLVKMNIASEAITAFASQPNAAVYGSALDSTGNFYIVGAFTTIGATTVNRVAKLATDGSTWSALASGVGGTCRAVAINPINNNIWVAGDTGLLAYYNGTRWNTITTSTSSTIYSLAFDEDGQLFIGGAFATIGGVSAEGVTKLYPANSSGLFFQLDIDLPSTPTVYAIYIDNDEITLGFSTAGTAVSPGTTTITNNGTANAYPVVKVTGPGTVRELTNTTTGKTIQFSGLTLGSGETMTLDLRLFKKTLKSNLRPALNSKIQQSDLDEWALQPGANLVNLLITDSSATGSMTWELLHESVDGGV